MLILAEEHGVLGHLSACLHALDTNLVPLEVKQSLKEYQRAQIFFSLRMVVELFRLLDRFASEGIGALRVKGPVLSVQAYGDPAGTAMAI